MQNSFIVIGSEKCVPHRFDLGGSAGSVGFGVEEDKALFSIGIGQADRVVILVWQAEIRRRLAFFQLGHN